MQASLEAETRGKAEAMRVKKKLESDINELEVGLDGANRGRAEAEKNLKKFQASSAQICIWNKITKLRIIVYWGFY